MNKETKLTSKVLRAMKSGETVTVEVPDRAALRSARSNVYRVQGVEHCKFSCHYEGLTLYVTRRDYK